MVHDLIGCDGIMSILLIGFVPFGLAVDTYIIGNSSQKIVECFANEPSGALPPTIGNEFSAMTANPSYS
jgi:hypothetical protein